MARNRNGEVYVVCNYNPAGNYLGSFTQNVLPLGGSSPSKKISFLDSKPHYTLDEQSWQQEALLVHNEYRRRHRVPDLRLSTELTSAAKVHLYFSCNSIGYNYLENKRKDRRGGYFLRNKNLPSTSFRRCSLSLYKYELTTLIVSIIAICLEPYDRDLASLQLTVDARAQE